MKYIIFTLAISSFLFCSRKSTAQNNYFIIKDPLSWSSYTYPGEISGVGLEVTPRGLYAEVSMVFTIGLKDNSVSSAMLLEGILNFDLPAGSFIHDSWLWLDDTTIISADVIERNQAVNTYVGIVRRKKDPSLLINTLPAGYRFNVYPVRSDYPRKVRITYSVPFTWKGGKAMLNLPLNIFRMSPKVSDINLLVHADSVYGQPDFLNHSFHRYVVAYTSNSYSFQIPGNDYGTAADFTLRYKTPAAGRGLLYAYPTAPGQGVFQYMLPPDTSLPSPGNVVFVLDPRSGKEIYTVPELKRMLQHSLLADLGPADSFNIFYASGTLANKVSAGWLVADSANINAAIKSIPAAPATTPASYLPLLEEALAFSQTKPGRAQTILISSNGDYNNKALADTAFQKLNNQPGGSGNRVSVINNSREFNDNSALYQELTRASGGRYFRSNGSFYDDYTAVRSFDLDVPGMLRQILYGTGAGIRGYSTRLPLNGITVNEDEPLNSGEFAPGYAYSRLGLYFGVWQDTGSVELTYTVPGGGLRTIRTALAGVYGGDEHTYKSWVFNYLRQLKANGAVPAIIDSCISNRLLYDYTAFLALETGDTIKEITKEQGAVLLSVSKMQMNELKAFPNPLRDGVLTIEWAAGISKLQVMDLMGRVVIESAPESDKAFWDGKNANGQAVSPGIYLVVATDRMGNRSVVKIRKE